MLPVPNVIHPKRRHKFTGKSKESKNVLTYVKHKTNNDWSHCVEKSTVEVGDSFSVNQQKEKLVQL